MSANTTLPSRSTDSPLGWFTWTWVPGSRTYPRALGVAVVTGGTGAHHRRDGAGGRVDLDDPVGELGSRVDRAVGANDDGQQTSPVPSRRQRADRAVDGDAPHAGDAVGDQQHAVGIDRDAVGGWRAGPPVAGPPSPHRPAVTPHAGAGHRRDGAGRIDLAHPAKRGVGDVQRPVEADGQPAGLAQQRRGGGTAVAAGRCGDRRIRRPGSRRPRRTPPHRPAGRWRRRRRRSSPRPDERGVPRRRHRRHDTATRVGERAGLEQRGRRGRAGPAGRRRARRRQRRLLRRARQQVPWRSRPAAIAPGLPSGHVVTTDRSTPVRSVLANGTGPNTSPVPNASGHSHAAAADRCTWRALVVGQAAAVQPRPIEAGAPTASPRTASHPGGRRR